MKSIWFFLWLVIGFYSSLEAFAASRSETFTDSGGKKWKINVEEASSRNLSPVFFLPHSDEVEALDVARKYIQKYKRGTIVWLDCGGQRTCSGTDPNRYFGFCDKEKDPQNKGMAKFREKIFSYFSQEDVVITLHNNKGCAHGSLICTRNPYKGARPIVANPNRPADILILNGPEDPPKDSRAQFSSCVKGAMINQFYEKSGAVADCSMSEAATRLGKYYYNVDFEEGLADTVSVQLAGLEKSLVCKEKAFRGKAQSPGTASSSSTVR